MAPLNFFVVALLGLVSIVHGLEVSPGSSCATYCVDLPDGDGFNPAASTTKHKDIVCQDLEYTSTAEGIKFKQCLECLQKSPKVNGTESDVKSYLYNLRYAVDTCLFGLNDTDAGSSSANATAADKVISSPCLIGSACLPMKEALMTSINDPLADPFAYCTANGTKFPSPNLNWCKSCLQASGNQVYLANFMIALDSGCQQKPKPGVALGLSGTLFSSSAINITAPAEDTSNTPAGASATTMTMGTIVGISVGASLFFLGGTALFFVYWRRQRKPSDGGSGASSPAGKKSASPDTDSGSSGPSRHGSYIPLSANTKSGSIRSMSQLGSYMGEDPKNNFQSNADYYDKVEEEYRSRQFNFDPHNKSSNGPNSALPTHPAYIPRALSRQSRSSHIPSRLNLPPRSNTPDSYTLRTYLNLPEETPRSGSKLSPSYPPLTASTIGSHLTVASHHTAASHQTAASHRSAASHHTAASYMTAGSQVTIGPAGSIYTATPQPSPPGRPAYSGSPQPSPPGRSVYTISPQPSPNNRSTYTVTPQPSPPPQPTTSLLSGAPVPPPPPPPRYPKVPALVMPSIPRIKGARKYSPPKIVVQDPTPIEEPEERRKKRMQITGPLAVHQQRFQDRPLGGPVQYATEAPERQSPDDYYTGDIPIPSGKTLLYG